MLPIYASLEDLASCGVPEEALRDIGDAEKLKALAQASREADTRLAARYSLPLVSWGEDLRQIVCIIAAFRLLTFRGWNPHDAVNGGISMLYNQALKTLVDVANGRAVLNVVDTAPEPAFQPDVSFTEPRGW